MEAEIKKQFPDAQIALVQGSGGVFDVLCDGKRVFSKQYGSEHRFPHAGEIAELLKSLK